VSSGGTPLIYRMAIAKVPWTGAYLTSCTRFHAEHGSQADPIASLCMFQSISLAS
jgi:hypothetical protein